MAEYRLVMRDVVKVFPGVKALDHARLELRPGTSSTKDKRSPSPPRWTL